MIAKEKAKELVDSFINISPIDVPEWLAKKCALITVNEIIDNCENVFEADYWKEKELEHWKAQSSQQIKQIAYGSE